MFEKMMTASRDRGLILTHSGEISRPLLALTRARSRPIIMPISCSLTHEKILELFLALAHSR